MTPAEDDETNKQNTIAKHTGKIKVVEHSTATKATDVINILILLVVSFGGACSIDNIVSCYVFFALMILLILIKYLKVEI